nr:phosphotransferase [Edaphobacter aggregans]
MPTQNATLEQIEYRVVLALPNSQEVLVRYDGAVYRLPHVTIPKWARPSEELQQAIKRSWNLSVIILDFPPSPEGAPRCVVAQVHSLHHSDALTTVELDQLPESEITEQQRAMAQRILVGQCGERGCFLHRGWIDEAIEWLHSEAGKSISSTEDIRQYNASATFALVRFPMQDGSAYWLKATGAPNAHELAVTAALSKLCPEYLSPPIAVRRDWNAWLMREAGRPLETDFGFLALEQAVVSMSELQKTTVGSTEELRAAGAVEQRVGVLRAHFSELFNYLEEAMAQQISTKVPRLERQRLSEIGLIFQDACLRMEDLGIPDAVIHGDMNRGNILFDLFDDFHCRFIDWSEAYIGNPFVSFQHLLLLNTGELRETNDLRLKQAYRRAWLGLLDPVQIDAAFALMPLLAAASYLYGRGDWLRSSRRNDPQRQSYARSLARHMDRAAQAPELQEVLCH